MAAVEQGNIVTSTGVMGIDMARSGDRGYANIPGIRHASYVNRLTRWAQQAHDRLEPSRLVGRVIIPQSEIPQLDLHSQNHLEAAIPIPFSDGEMLLMATFGLNRSTRTISAERKAAIIQKTTEMGVPDKTPEQRVTAKRNDGYTFHAGRISPEIFDEVYQDWAHAFGWTKQNLLALQHRLVFEQLKSPPERGLWFTALLKEGQVKGLAMAERLDIPTEKGPVSAIELTEWFIFPPERGNGSGPSMVSHCITQVLEDMQYVDHPMSVFAEVNFLANAHFVANRAGLEVPPRDYQGVKVPQVLVQNLEVGDDIEVSGYRDFVVVYLPPLNRDKYYNAEARQVILGQ